jgi:hypothetical protein
MSGADAAVQRIVVGSSRSIKVRNAVDEFSENGDRGVKWIDATIVDVFREPLTFRSSWSLPGARLFGGAYRCRDRTPNRIGGPVQSGSRSFRESVPSGEHVLQQVEAGRSADALLTRGPGGARRGSVGSPRPRTGASGSHGLGRLASSPDRQGALQATVWTALFVSPMDLAWARLAPGRFAFVAEIDLHSDQAGDRSLGCGRCSRP